MDYRPSGCAMASSKDDDLYACLEIDSFALPNNSGHFIPAFFSLKSIMIVLMSIVCMIPQATLAEKPPTNLQFVHLLNDQGVSVGSVETIFQDHLGYMWFGGPDGLVQYDGYNYIVHRNKPGDVTSLSSNIVWDIHEDKQRNLWIATDRGLNRLDRNTRSFIRFEHDEKNPDSLAINTIRSIAEDAMGNLWIASTNGLFKFNPERTKFTGFYHNPNVPNSLAGNEVRRVFIDKSGTRLWLGYYGRGLGMLDINTGDFTHYPAGVRDGTGVSHSTLICIFQDRDGYIWVGTEGAGLNRFNPATNEFIYFFAQMNNRHKLSSDIVTDITEDDKGNLWVATEWGLNVIDRKTLSIYNYINDPYQKSSLASSNIHSLFIDSNRDLWVGNFPAGVNFLDTSSLTFRTYRHDPNDANSLANVSVLSIDENPKGVFWLGNDAGGLNRFELATEKFTRYEPNPQNAKTISPGAVLNIRHTPEGHIWLGTWHGGVNQFDPVTAEVITRYTGGDPNEGLTNNNIWALNYDRNRNLWLGTIGGGLHRLPPDGKKFINYRDQFPSGNFFVVWKVFEDHQGNIWIGANEGLGRYVPEKDHFVFYKHDDNDPSSLSFDVVLDIAEDTKQQLWVATRGGGLNLFDRQSETFKHYRIKDGLPDDVVRSVAADNSGNIWLGSARGLTQFNPETGQFVTYDENNGLQGNLFNFSAALRTSDGEMIFGGTNGFTIFDPAKLSPNNHIPPVVIVDFQIFNKPVTVGVEGSPLSKDISQTHSITLNHHQSVFSFGFSAMSYRNPEKNTFAYKMEGFEKDWNYVGADRRNATYTNLNAGTYTFKVKAANNEGLWNGAGHSITIHVLPAPWKTWWAYSLYALFVFGLLRWFVYSQHKQVVVLESKVNERTAELQSKHRELENAYAQLEAISLSDPLTGLNNRRYLQKLIPMDVIKIQREYAGGDEKPKRKESLDFTFLLLDIDFFKQVNDSHGHLAGDQLLIQISQLLTKICRESDCLVRWGGEEFLIVSRFASRDEAPLMADRIRETMAKHEFTLPDGTLLQKTCSIGFACYPFLKDNPLAVSWEQVIDVADRALYAAKKSGRNRSVGLAASEQISSNYLHERLSADLPRMIANGELIVMSSSAEPLIWD